MYVCKYVTCTHVKVQVLEYRRAGIDTIALEVQITIRKTRAKVFDILGFKGLTMAMYLEKNIYILEKSNGYEKIFISEEWYVHISVQYGS